MPRDPSPARFPPWLGVVVAVVSVSFAAPLFRLSGEAAGTASYWRLALAALLLLPFSRSAWPVWRRYSWRDWAVVAAAGAALALHFLLWVTSLAMTTVAASTSLVTLQAVFVALGAHFLLREALSRRAWWGVAVACGGAIALGATDGALAPDSQRAVAGDALALLAGLGSAAYFLVGRHLRATRGLVEYTLPVYAAAASMLLAALPILGQPAWPAEPMSFGLLLALAVVPMLGGHTVANWVIRYVPAHTVAAWILLEPAGAALLAWPLLHEVPPWPVFAGGAVVLAGAALTVPRRRDDLAAAEPAT